jgi:formylglycine-generating enzyme required for sulfatase activity
VPKGKRIFLAHSSIDKELVRKLYKELKKRGLQPWLDEEDLLPGQNWRIEIPKAIRECEYFIACLSERAIHKQGYVNKEFRMALDIYAEKPPGSIYLIPLKFDDCGVPDIQHPELGAKLRDIHWLDYWKSDGLERLLKVIGNGKEGGPASSGPKEKVPENNSKWEESPPKEVKTDSSVHGNMPSWVMAVSVVSALVFITVLLVIALFVSDPTRFQIFVFRIVLALAAAAFGATLPGFFTFRMSFSAKGFVHAGGALGLFVLIFLVNPPELIAPPSLQQTAESQPGIDADTKKNELKKESRISVQTDPENAAIKILNIAQKFYQGMELSPGDYYLEVSAPGYKSQKKWVTLSAGEDKRMEFRLNSVEPAEKFSNSLGMEFVYIPPGSFMMGSPKNEADRDNDESRHRVSLTQGYYMGTTEVTQGQWQAVMGRNPSEFKDCGEECPVESVSWNDVLEFIRKLNQRESNYQYRLPTEAEWEYAARAGTTTPFSFGSTLGTDQANYYGNGSKGIYRRKTIPAKSFSPNAWGLYNMHGNVWEWCQDWYGEYPSGNVIDPQGSQSGDDRVLRGGSWSYEAGSCRSADRVRDEPGNRLNVSGFRLAASLFSR